MSRYKVVTYVPFVPEDTLPRMLHALRELPVNRIGAYESCMSMVSSTGTWKSLDDANPFIGEVGESTTAPEIRIEFVCDENDVRTALRAIRGTHPYEEPEIDIYALVDEDEFDE